MFHHVGKALLVCVGSFNVWVLQSKTRQCLVRFVYHLEVILEDTETQDTENLNTWRVLSEPKRSRLIWVKQTCVKLQHGFGFFFGFVCECKWLCVFVHTYRAGLVLLALRVVPVHRALPGRLVVLQVPAVPVHRPCPGFQRYQGFLPVLALPENTTVTFCKQKSTNFVKGRSKFCSATSFDVSERKETKKTADHLPSFTKRANKAAMHLIIVSEF